ncbi:hypothetical protein EV186_110157 [Labedaea rhizosphaerae]|uniref:Uncharacterized protein n=1 Tax=Labedaea rhizosphaerae TaxID=598644 RepID=A0A4R6RWS0_LABRH|nr:hypothetical protein EV186_110157 [Labedaea rhizosphaerae]
MRIVMAAVTQADTSGPLPPAWYFDAPRRPR